ncbi:MAG: NifB/NifX family molybdenum-iron cluster-binding protein [Dissulfurimicrobium sp.]
MKVAVSAKGQDMSAMIDPRFGRADYLLIIDASSRKMLKVIDNRGSQNAAQGAGINTASRMVNEGVEVVLTGRMGPKAFDVLRAAGVKIISGVSGTVGEALDGFLKGDYQESSGPDNPGHFGGAGMAMGRGMGGGRGRCRAFMTGMGIVVDRFMGGCLGLGRGIGIRARRRDFSCLRGVDRGIGMISGRRRGVFFPKGV